MRSHWFSASSSVVALVLGLSSASAQDAAGGTIGAQGGVNLAPGGGSSASGSTQTQVEIGSVQTKAVVTPAEQVAQGDEIAKRANQLATRLTKMLDEARRDKDIMRANCVNRKLTEVNANARNIDQRKQALKDANATNDEARRSHEFTVLTVLAQKLESLDQEATQCLGQSIYEPGASQVITTVPGITAGFADPSTVSPIPPPPPSLSVPPGMSNASPATPSMN